MRRLSQIIQMALNAVLDVLIRRRRRCYCARKRRNLTRKAETGVMWPQAKGGWQPPGAGRGKDVILPWNLQREHGLAKSLDFSSVMQILDFWPPELREYIYIYTPLREVYILREYIYI